MNISDFRNKLSKKIVVWALVIESIIFMQGCIKSKESPEGGSELKNLMEYVVDNNNKLSDSEKSKLVEAIGIRYLGVIRQEIKVGDFDNAKNMLEALKKFFLSVQNLQDMHKLKDVENELLFLLDVRMAVDSMWNQLSPDVVVKKPFGKIIMVSNMVANPSNAYYVCFKKAEMIAHSNGLKVKNMIFMNYDKVEGRYVAKSVFLLE